MQLDIFAIYDNFFSEYKDRISQTIDLYNRIIRQTRNEPEYKLHATSLSIFRSEIYGVIDTYQHNNVIYDSETIYSGAEEPEDVDKGDVIYDEKMVSHHDRKVGKPGQLEKYGAWQCLLTYMKISNGYNASLHDAVTSHITTAIYAPEDIIINIEIDCDIIYTSGKDKKNYDSQSIRYDTNINRSINHNITKNELCFGTTLELEELLNQTKNLEETEHHNFGDTYIYKNDRKYIRHEFIKPYCPISHGIYISTSFDTDLYVEFINNTYLSSFEYLDDHIPIYWNDNYIFEEYFGKNPFSIRHNPNVKRVDGTLKRNQQEDDILEMISHGIREPEPYSIEELRLIYGE